ncbi:MAG: hypothetical protein HY906_08410 [Deltaproteobacteria bacterium]|nr:hypothetical protein [Deltaproteobacteria bacterium]
MIRRVTLLGLLALVGSAGCQPSRRADATPSGPASQRPLDVVVANPHAAPRYLDWTATHEATPSCSRREGSAWKRCAFAPPFCVDECPAPGAPPGCRECARPPNQVRVVPAKGSVRLPWDGVLYETEKRGEWCLCYRKRAPTAGRYRARVCAWPGVSCGRPPCTPDANGTITDASPTGAEACVHVEVDLPTTAGAVTLTLE